MTRPKSCADCGREVRARNEPGSVPVVVARGLCAACYSRARYGGRLADWPRRTVSRDDVLDDWHLLRLDGYTVAQAAPRLGMSVPALVQALQRAKRRGDPRARFDYRGTWRLRVAS